MPDAFDYVKNNKELIQKLWLRELPIVSYGFVSEVIDKYNVRIIPVLQQESETVQEIDVTLLGLSSALFEVNIQPQEKDLVLLLAMNKMHPEMFNDIESRTEDDHVIFDNTHNGYSVNSMTGILVSTLKAASAIQVSVYKDEDDVILSASIAAKTAISSRKKFEMGFVSGDGKEHEVNFSVGEKRPININQRSKLKQRVGFKGVEKDEDEDERVEALSDIWYSEKAPIDFRSDAAINIKRDPDDEHDAPTVIQHGKGAPIYFDSSAPITAVLGEDADIEIISDAGIKMAFEKAFDLVFGGVLELVSRTAIKLFVQGTGLLTIGNQINTIGGILDIYNDILMGFHTVGSPAEHFTSPATQALLTAAKAIQNQVVD